MHCTHTYKYINYYFFVFNQAFFLAVELGHTDNTISRYKWSRFVTEDVLPVTEPTVSKHQSKFQAVTPTRQNHLQALSILHPLFMLALRQQYSIIVYITVVSHFLF